MVHSTKTLSTEATSSRDIQAAQGASDVLSDILRAGAQKMLKAAVEQEVSDYINERTDIVDENGHRLVVRNGSLPEREILTGVGPIAVSQPRVRDKRSP